MPLVACCLLMRWQWLGEFSCAMCIAQGGIERLATYWPDDFEQAVVGCPSRCTLVLLRTHIEDAKAHPGSTLGDQWTAAEPAGAAVGLAGKLAMSTFACIRPSAVLVQARFACATSTTTVFGGGTL